MRSRIHFMMAVLAAMVLGVGPASAGMIGDGFGLTFDYDVISTESNSLVFGSPGLLDSPPEQEWVLQTALGAPLGDGDMSLSFDLTYSDASFFNAAMEFSLLGRGLADGSGTPLEIVGDISLWFTPQMDPATDPGIVLVEETDWQQQQQASGDLRFRIGRGPGITTLVPALLAPARFPGGHERINDLHWRFDVRQVPEPTTLALLGAGLLPLLLRRR